jgi:hypothetical protein
MVGTLGSSLPGDTDFIQIPGSCLAMPGLMSPIPDAIDANPVERVAIPGPIVWISGLMNALPGPMVVTPGRRCTTLSP